MKKALLINGIFSETMYVFVYLQTEFQVSVIILANITYGREYFYSLIPHPPQNEPLKASPRFGLTSLLVGYISV